MSNVLSKKIEELKHCIELSNNVLQDCDQEIEVIKQKKLEIKDYIVKCETDIKALELASNVITAMKTQEKPFLVKEKFHKGNKRNFVLKNLSVKTEVIKILKENPDKLWLAKELGQELLLRDGQSPDVYSNRVKNSILITVKNLCEKGFAERIEKNKKVYWRKAK